MDESVVKVAWRELQEEMGFTRNFLRLFLTFKAPDRVLLERVIIIAYYVMVRFSDVIGGDGAADAVGFALNDLSSLVLEYDQI